MSARAISRIFDDRRSRLGRVRALSVDERNELLRPRGEDRDADHERREEPEQAERDPEVVEAEVGVRDHPDARRNDDDPRGREHPLAEERRLTRDRGDLGAVGRAFRPQAEDRRAPLHRRPRPPRTGRGPS